jgi:hypothetical protein
MTKLGQGFLQFSGVSQLFTNLDVLTACVETHAEVGCHVFRVIWLSLVRLLERFESGVIVVLFFSPIADVIRMLGTLRQNGDGNGTQDKREEQESAPFHFASLFNCL